MLSGDAFKGDTLPYAEAVRELVGLAHLCEREGTRSESERLRGALDITAVIYGVKRSELVVDLKAALALDGIILDI